MYREENFQGVDFKLLENSISDNSSEENSLVAVLIYYLIIKNNLLREFMELPTRFTDGIRYAFCERIFKEQNLLKYQINQMIDTRTKERKKNLLQFYHAYNDALDFIFGLLVIQKNSEEKIIKNIWSQITRDRENIDLLVGKEDLPDYFDEMIDYYESLLEETLVYEPYYFTAQYDIDLKTLKKENFDQLKSDAKSIITDSFGIGTNFVKKIIPSSNKKNDDLGIEGKLQKIETMKEKNLISSSEYQKMRNQILSKFSGGGSADSSDIADNINENFEDDERVNIDNIDDKLKQGIIITTEFIENIVLNPLKAYDKKLPDTFWQDDFVIGFITYLTVITYDDFVDTSNVSTETKGEILNTIFKKFCPEDYKLVIKNFTKLMNDPSTESERGRELSMKLCSIADGTFNDTFSNDADIEKARTMSETLYNESSLNELNNIENQELYMAFLSVHFNDYVVGLFKKDK
jgi:hypothetical protein